MNVAPASRPGLVRCPSCYTLLQGPWVEGEQAARQCERCRSELQITVFPPLFQVPWSLSTAGERALEGEATCFFHPEKRAERACDRCGRFLCALCDLPVGARHLCPACLKAGNEEKALPELVSKRVSWGRLALLLSVVPLFPLFWGFFFITAPAAVFLAIFGWNKPGSLVHGKRRISATFGLLFGLAQIALIGVFIYFVWKGATHRAR